MIARAEGPVLLHTDSRVDTQSAVTSKGQTICFQSAGSCVYHVNTKSQRTRYINVSTNDHVLHEYNLVEVKRERLLGRIVAASTRTVKVTISIALDSYRILTITSADTPRNRSICQDVEFKENNAFVLSEGITRQKKKSTLLQQLGKNLKTCNVRF